MYLARPASHIEGPDGDTLALDVRVHSFSSKNLEYASWELHSPDTAYSTVMKCPFEDLQTGHLSGASP